MPPKRKSRRPRKLQPISPEKLRPTAKSPPPLLQRKRERPLKSQPASAPVGTKKPRGKRRKDGGIPQSNRLFKATRILDESGTEYLIEWAEKNPKIGKTYEPSWHPKTCASRELVKEWEMDKNGEEWAAKGIVDEDKYRYKVAWENHPKTGEVFEDTWEPKAFVSKSLVQDWENSLSMGTNAFTSRVREDEASVSGEDEGEEAADQGQDNDDADDALQHQISQEMLNTQVSTGNRSPIVQRRGR